MSAVDSLILTAEKVDHHRSASQSESDTKHVVKLSDPDSTKIEDDPTLDLNVDLNMQKSRDDTVEIEVCDCVIERSKLNGEEEVATVRIKRSQTQVAKFNEQESKQSEASDVSKAITICECAQERMYGLDYLDKMPRVVGYIFNQEKEDKNKEENVDKTVVGSSSKSSSVEENQEAKIEHKTPEKVRFSAEVTEVIVEESDVEPVKLIRAKATSDLRLIDDEIPEKIDSSKIDEIRNFNDTLSSDTVQPDNLEDFDYEKTIEMIRSQKNDDLRDIEDKMSSFEPPSNLKLGEMLSQVIFT